MAITLKQIEAEQSRVGQLIEEFKKQPTAYTVSGVVIPLAPGERYAGAILKEDGTLDYHLIKLPGEASTTVPHGDALAYAKNRGGETPTLREHALMRTNLRAEFKNEAYWAADKYEGDSSYAWYQYFDDGLQTYTRKGSALRAVAVRRFIPSII